MKYLDLITGNVSDTPPENSCYVQFSCTDSLCTAVDVKMEGCVQGSMSVIMEADVRLFDDMVAVDKVRAKIPEGASIERALIMVESSDGTIMGITEIDGDSFEQSGDFYEAPANLSVFVPRNESKVIVSGAVRIALGDTEFWSGKMTLGSFSTDFIVEITAGNRRYTVSSSSGKISVSVDELQTSTSVITITKRQGAPTVHVVKVTGDGNTDVYVTDTRSAQFTFESLKAVEVAGLRFEVEDAQLVFDISSDTVELISSPNALPRTGAVVAEVETVLGSTSTAITSTTKISSLIQGASGYLRHLSVKRSTTDGDTVYHFVPLAVTEMAKDLQEALKDKLFGIVYPLPQGWDQITVVTPQLRTSGADGALSLGYEVGGDVYTVYVGLPNATSSVNVDLDVKYGIYTPPLGTRIVGMKVLYRLLAKVGGGTLDIPFVVSTIVESSGSFSQSSSVSLEGLKDVVSQSVADMLGQLDSLSYTLVSLTEDTQTTSPSSLAVEDATLNSPSLYTSATVFSPLLTVNSGQAGWVFPIAAEVYLYDLTTAEIRKVRVNFVYNLQKVMTNVSAVSVYKVYTVNIAGTELVGSEIPISTVPGLVIYDRSTGTVVDSVSSFLGGVGLNVSTVKVSLGSVTVDAGKVSASKDPPPGMEFFVTTLADGVTVGKVKAGSDLTPAASSLLKVGGSSLTVQLSGIAIMDTVASVAPQSSIAIVPPSISVSTVACLDDTTGYVQCHSIRVDPGTFPAYLSARSVDGQMTVDVGKFVFTSISTVSDRDIISNASVASGNPPVSPFIELEYGALLAGENAVAIATGMTGISVLKSCAQICPTNLTDPAWTVSVSLSGITFTKECICGGLSTSTSVQIPSIDVRPTGIQGIYTVYISTGNGTISSVRKIAVENASPVLKESNQSLTSPGAYVVTVSVDTDYGPLSVPYLVVLQGVSVREAVAPTGSSSLVVEAVVFGNASYTVGVYSLAEWLSGTVKGTVPSDTLTASTTWFSIFMKMMSLTDVVHVEITASSLRFAKTFYGQSVKGAAYAVGSGIGAILGVIGKRLLGA